MLQATPILTHKYNPHISRNPIPYLHDDLPDGGTVGGDVEENPWGGHGAGDGLDLGGFSTETSEGWTSKNSVRRTIFRNRVMFGLCLVGTSILSFGPILYWCFPFLSWFSLDHPQNLTSPICGSSISWHQQVMSSVNFVQLDRREEKEKGRFLLQILS